MLARCPACSELFAVIGSARTTCAFCGAQVEVEVHRMIGPAGSSVAPRAVARAAARDGQSRVSIETLAESDVQKLARKETEAAFAEARRGAMRMGRFRGGMKGPRLTPWERPGAGRLDRLGETLHLVIGSPSKFFGELSADRLGGALSFAALIVLPTVLFQAIVMRHLFLDPRWPYTVAIDLEPTRFLSRVAILTALWVVGMAVYYQVFGSLASGRRLRFRGTVRATCYGFAPMLVAVVPVIGLAAGVLGSMVLHTIALRRHHGLTRIAAVVIVMFPMVPLAWWLI